MVKRDPKILFSCIMIIFFISYSVLSVLSSASVYEKFSFTFENKSLSETLRIISEKTGYRIYLQQGGEDLKINLSLKKLTLEEVISRVLKNTNYTVIWDTEEKKIMLSLYDGSIESNMPLKEVRTLRHESYEEEIVDNAGNQDSESFKNEHSGGSAVQIKDLKGRNFHRSGGRTRFIQGTDTTVHP